MKCDFSTPILDLYGQPLIEPLSPEQFQRALLRLPQEVAQQVLGALKLEAAEPVTLANVASGALIAGFEDERALPLEEKVKRMKLALRIVDGGEVEITTDDVGKIKACVNKRFPGALKPARVHEILEGDPKAIDRDSQQAQ